MPRTAQPLEIPYLPTPNRLRWSRQQCDEMREYGLIQGRYEVINGEVIRKTGQSPIHACAVVIMAAALYKLFDAMQIAVGMPLWMTGEDADYNEPEPDVAVTREPATHYEDRHPSATEALLVVEISDENLWFDRGPKANLYARSGVADYWIVDVSSGLLYVHRRPTEGGYSQVLIYEPQETCSMLYNPEGVMKVSELLPPNSPGSSRRLRSKESQEFCSA